MTPELDFPWSRIAELVRGSVQTNEFLGVCKKFLEMYDQSNINLNSDGDLVLLCFLLLAKIAISSPFELYMFWSMTVLVPVIKGIPSCPDIYDFLTRLSQKESNTVCWFKTLTGVLKDDFYSYPNPRTLAEVRYTASAI